MAEGSGTVASAGVDLIALQVHAVATGLTFDVDVAPSHTVASLKTALEPFSGLPATQIILLIDGVEMADRRPLGSYTASVAGADREAGKESQDGPLDFSGGGATAIFLYDRSIFDPATEIPTDVHIQTISTPELVLPPSPATVAETVEAIGETLQSLQQTAQERLTQCRFLAREQKIQEAGRREAVRNMQTHADRALATWRTFLRQHRDQHTAHAALLATFDDDLARTREVAVVAPLDANGTRPTLFDWVPESKVRDWARDCAKAHAKLARKVGALEDDVGALEGGVHGEAMTAPVLRRDMIDDLIGRAETLAAEQSAAISAAERQLGTVIGGGDRGAEILDAVKTRAVAAIQRRDRALIDVTDELAGCKEETTRRLFRRLGEVAALSSRIPSLRKKVALYAEAHDYQARAFRQLVHLRRMPSAYWAALVEVERRSRFKDAFMAHVADFSERVANIEEEEGRRRQKFHAAHGRYLPTGLVPGLVSRLPRVEVSAKPFDDDLPALALDDVRDAVERFRTFRGVASAHAAPTAGPESLSASLMVGDEDTWAAMVADIGGVFGALGKPTGANGAGGSEGDAMLFGSGVHKAVAEAGVASAAASPSSSSAAGGAGAPQSSSSAAGGARGSGDLAGSAAGGEQWLEEMTALRAERDAHAARVAELEARLLDVTSQANEVAALEARVAEYETLLADARVETERERVAVDELGASLDTAQDALEAQALRVADLEAQLATVEQATATDGSEAAVDAAVDAALRDAALAHAAEVEELRGEIETLQGDLAEAAVARETSEAEAARVLDELEQTTAEATAAIQDLTDRLAAAEMERDRALVSVDDVSSQRDAARTKRKALVDELALVTERAMAAEAAAEEAHNRAEAAAAESGTKDGSLAGLEQQVASLTERATAAERRVGDMQAEANGRRAVESQLRADLARLRVELESTASDLTLSQMNGARQAELESLLASAEDEAVRLRGALETSQAEAADARAQADDRQEEIASLRAVLAVNEDEIGRIPGLEAATREAREAAASAESALVQAETVAAAEAEETARRLAVVSNEAEALRLQLGADQDALASLERDLAAAQAALAASTESVAALRSILRDVVDVFESIGRETGGGSGTAPEAEYADLATVAESLVNDFTQLEDDLEAALRAVDGGASAGDAALVSGGGGDGEGRPRISFLSFEPGDVALFLPISYGGHYVAFNVGCPHYYLSEESLADLDGEHDHFIRQIVHIEAAVADEADNPYSLAHGLRFFKVHAVPFHPL